MHTPSHRIHTPTVTHTHTHTHTHRYKGNNQRIQLTATRSTRYHPLNIPTDEHFSNYIPRLHTPISQLNTSELAYGEFDTVGIVVCVTSGHVPSRDLERPDRILDTFYLANHDGNLLEVKVWDGLKVLYSCE